MRSRTGARDGVESLHTSAHGVLERCDAAISPVQLFAGSRTRTRLFGDVTLSRSGFES